MNVRRPLPVHSSHARVISVAENARCLDAEQLRNLEQSFRDWAEAPRSHGRGMSRRRLNEVLKLEPQRDIDYQAHSVVFRKAEREGAAAGRDVQIPEVLSAEIHQTLKLGFARRARRGFFSIDPGHVRRKFYERAAACGMPRELGAPEVIRRSRAVELLQSNMPLPVVQKILGHSTPNLAASYVKFSEEDMRRAEAFFVDRENRRKTSARNAFFGKIESLRKGDIQAWVEISTPGGYRIRAVITNHSLERLGLKRGALVAAEVKAPWVTIHRSADDLESSADNVLGGTVEHIVRGKVTSEIVARIADGTEICSIVTEQSLKKLNLRPADRVWVAFNAFTVVLHAD
jgi:molybdate transport system regulatory protein